MVDRTELVDASPVKRFFIDILTRDVSLVAAIMDLVDNSIDSARSLRSQGDLSGIKVAIVATPTEFSIEDNCAGIGVENAKSYVFRMGRPDGVDGTPGSIGQFGVGMKRSLFKLGTSIIVESTTATDGFTIELPVDEWMTQEAWTFPMTVHDHSPTDKTGTTIIVDVLQRSVQEAFADEVFMQSLRDELRSRHRLAVGNGLTLILNDEVMPPADSTVAVSDVIAPALRSFTLEVDGQPLTVRIVAGVAATASTGIDEDGEPESQSRAAADAGWMVFGNGRLLLANDKSALTGWGSGRKNMPQYHNQFARFRGFVYLESEDPGAIPWNTSKTNVDPDSAVWRAVRAAMIESGRDVINLLNQAKAERQVASPSDATPTLDALRAAHSVDAPTAFTTVEVRYSMMMAELREDVAVAASFPAANPHLAAATWKKIQYTVESEAFYDLVAAVGTDNAAEIGRQSFDEFHARHVNS